MAGKMANNHACPILSVIKKTNLLKYCGHNPFLKPAWLIVSAVWSISCMGDQKRSNSRSKRQQICWHVLVQRNYHVCLGCGDLGCSRWAKECKLRHHINFYNFLYNSYIMPSLCAKGRLCNPRKNKCSSFTKIIADRASAKPARSTFKAAKGNCSSENKEWSNITWW